MGSETFVFDRRGSVLLVVLVVVALLALGAYTFSETMLIETEAASAHERSVQTRVFVDSGVEFAAALLGEPMELGDANFYHNPEQFQQTT